MMTPAFYLGLATFTRQKEQSIGIYHETAVQKRIYEALDTAVIEQGAKRAFAAQVESEVNRLIALGKQLEKTPENIAQNRQIGRDIALGVTVLEHLADG